MMKYKLYKTLTKEQKEEYDYRFKDRVRFQIQSMIPYVYLLIIITILLVFTTYLTVSTEIFKPYIKDITNIYIMAGKVILVTAYIIIIYMLDYSIRLIIFNYQYSKWKKKNNIKETQWKI